MSRPTRSPYNRGPLRSGARGRRLPRAVAVAGAVLALGALAAVSLPDAAQAATGSPLQTSRENISYTVPGASIGFVAPAWATHATITIAGASGASTCAKGGRGTEVTTTTEVKGGETFSISLGENGKNVTGNARLGWGYDRVHVAAGGWGPSGMQGGSSTWRDIDGATDWGLMASGGGGSELRMNGKIVALVGGGGGAGTCADSSGGAGGSAWTGFPGASAGTLNGGSGGGFATSQQRAGDAAVNAGGGGGGASGGGYGSAGQAAPNSTAAGAGGGGAGGSWVAPELRWDTTKTADVSRAGSYATVVFANRDLHATGNLAADKPVNASSSLEYASFASSMLTDGFTRSLAGHSGFSTSDPRPGPGNGSTVQEWVEVDLGQAQAISSLRLYPRTTSVDDTTEVTGAGFPEAFTVEVSADGRSWKRVGSFSGQTDVTQGRTYAVSPAEARWVRLNVTTLGPIALGDVGHRLQLAEFEVYR